MGKDMFDWAPWFHRLTVSSNSRLPCLPASLVEVIQILKNAIWPQRADNHNLNLFSQEVKGDIGIGAV
jgi:hypothetical protein